MRIILATILLAALLQGCTTRPLHQAAIKGDKAAVQSLLEKGAKVDQTDNRGRTALYLAAQNGRKDVAELLLAKGANTTHRCILDQGNTPLHAAAKNGRDDIVELLLAANVSPDLRNRNRQTPLMLASWARLPETVALLLVRGADPKLQDDNGWSALHSLWRSKPGDANYEEIISLLVSYKPPVNLAGRNPAGFTPLMSACQIGDLKAVRLLLDAGAEVNVADDNGQTPYRIAAHHHNKPIMAELVQHGALIKPTFREETKKPEPKTTKPGQ